MGTPATWQRRGPGTPSAPRRRMPSAPDLNPEAPPEADPRVPVMEWLLGLGQLALRRMAPPPRAPSKR
jgi:hypothetical protein